MDLKFASRTLFYKIIYIPTLKHGLHIAGFEAIPDQVVASVFSFPYVLLPQGS